MTANRSTLDALARMARQPPAAKPKAAAPPAEDEEGWLDVVEEYARLRGWLVYHTRDSRRSEPGFPDLVLIRRRRIIFAELKTDRGRLTGSQKQWLGNLLGLGDPVEVYLWRPREWPDVERHLK